LAGKPDDDASLAKPSMELSDLVPPFVIDTVRDRLIVGVADAEAGFEHRADEGLSRHWGAARAAIDMFVVVTRCSCGQSSML
jgi:hypothetical protein